MSKRKKKYLPLTMDHDTNLTSTKPETFSLFDTVPFEMRRMIIKTMDFETVCKFMHGSKKCFQECADHPSFGDNFCLTLKGHKKQYKLKMTGRTGTDFQKPDTSWWSLEFTSESRSLTKVKLERNRYTFENHSWIENKQPADVFLQYLESYLKGFGKNLEMLEINVDADMSNRISKLRLEKTEKLQKLKIQANLNNVCFLSSGFIDFEQLKKVSRYIELPAYNISFDQIIQLKAGLIDLHRTNWTTNDAKMICEKWKEGKLDPNVKTILIYGKFDSEIETHPIYEELHSECVHLQGKSASLSFDSFCFTLHINDRCRYEDW